jgi:hypothetical protein
LFNQYQFLIENIVFNSLFKLCPSFLPDLFDVILGTKNFMNNHWEINVNIVSTTTGKESVKIAYGNTHKI